MLEDLPCVSLLLAQPVRNLASSSECNLEGTQQHSTNTTSVWPPIPIVPIFLSSTLSMLTPNMEANFSLTYRELCIAYERRKVCVRGCECARTHECVCARVNTCRTCLVLTQIHAPASSFLDTISLATQYRGPLPTRYVMRSAVACAGPFTTLAWSSRAGAPGIAGKRLSGRCSTARREAGLMSTFCWTFCGAQNSVQAKHANTEFIRRKGEAASGSSRRGTSPGKAWRSGFLGSCIITENVEVKLL